MTSPFPNPASLLCSLADAAIAVVAGAVAAGAAGPSCQTWQPVVDS